MSTKTTKTLREYQVEDKASIIEAWESFRSVLYQLPTGGGKSEIMTSIIQDYKTEQILVFAHKRKLLLQLKQHLADKGITAGVLAGGLQENLDSNIIIVSVMTAAKDSRLEALLARDWKKVFIDEARHSRTGSYDKVLEAIEEAHPTCQLLGFDATPYRKDRKRLDKHFQHLVISSESIKSLMEKGFLQTCKAVISPINLVELQKEVVEVANDYQVAALSTYMRKQKYLDYLLSQYITFGEERPAICFAVDKAHAASIMKTFEEGGYAGRVERVDSSMTEAQITDIYANYASGATQILINVEMITEGVDLPNAGCIIGARPTKSLTLYMQIIGRGMRADGVHKYFILLDCCGWTEEYGVITTPKTWSLNPEIHPNSGRIGNKIFGRKADGTLTADLDLFIGEVVELTPEEYMTQIAGGEQKAVDINAGIDIKIAAIYKKMVDLLINEKEYSKEYTVSFDKDSSELVITFNHNEEKETRSYYRNSVEIKFPSRTKIIYARATSSFDSGNASRYFDAQKLNGVLCGYLNKNVKYTKTAYEMLENIKDLEKSKINLDKFRQAKLAIENEKKELIIEQMVKNGETFEFPDSFNYCRYWKETSYEDSKQVKAVFIPKKQLLANNFMSIVYYTRKQAKNTETDKWEWVNVEATEENKYISKQKFMDVLKENNWSPKES